MENKIKRNSSKSPTPDYTDSSEVFPSPQLREEPSQQGDPNFVEPKFKRKGSRVYKNVGWKGSRSDSSSSVHRSISVLEMDDEKEKKVDYEKNKEQKEKGLNVEEMKPIEVFDDLLAILKDSGADF